MKFLLAICSLLLFISSPPDVDALMHPSSLLSQTVSASLVAPLMESSPEGGPEGSPGYPNVIINPKRGWGLSKPKPKKSLEKVGQTKTAAAWILNIVEFFHFFSFAIGFKLFWTMFNNIEKLGVRINAANPTFGFFFLLFAHVNQIYGGGFPIVMHQYEGWQIAEFRNPLKTHVEPEYNDAWLRAVAYQLLMSFQTLGALFIWVGIEGVTSTFQKGLIALTAFIIVFAPQLPHCTTVFPNLFKRFGLQKIWNKITNGNRPVFPLSIYLFLALIANSMYAALAYFKMFGAIDWVGYPVLQSLPGIVTSNIPFLLIFVGGAIFEGFIAETTFNQWYHLIAILMLDFGLFLHIPYYLKLIS